MTTVIGRTEGHYEVQKTSYGEAYVWRPECVVVECRYCGQRLVLSTSVSTCGCGADYAALVRKELLASRKVSSEALHPWEQEYREWLANRDEYLHSEYNELLERGRLE